MRLALERRAVLSLGANLGDRLATIDAAVRALDAIDGIRVLERSSAWESPSWHPDGEGLSPDYVNVVLIVGTTLEPLDLLDAVNAVEDALGRVRAERWGSRTIDIDIVTIGGVERAEDRLVLPHPRAHERQFVLQPWLELEPEASLPGHGPIAELAEYADGDVWRLA
ncbi:2-amino-4-hydroxy-6-hydroxymethyldihydropteridine diphosphokinase [Agrococcus sediminis]|uniref:2-amino-4-hydroxy-6-hydroxymethyldihydropteridine diphosphokinase n=1 Tax=Agrococcus sediminis TaxID=2599924 RepID=A0A5M8QJK7_9MICO|nr:MULTISPECIES: 2-amino-4-hydroxy-6-hydroxymethyldihydropteridine diphosphokinase [Agrococcus]KAA6435164.1 2-amino-4-hydroxy-6-hydroxymethyldihydropteridine diphosphokinase [Agrococcus sediminis]UOW01991.1 2-amino-4-hydroxy-6-hydroxymethyldihydropteridine diphosphokinase [Agrococcus sp. SCSIO52902]